MLSNLRWVGSLVLIVYTLQCELFVIKQFGKLVNFWWSWKTLCFTFYRHIVFVNSLTESLWHFCLEFDAVTKHLTRRRLLQIGNGVSLWSWYIYFSVLYNGNYTYFICSLFFCDLVCIIFSVGWFSDEDLICLLQC